PTTSVIPGHTPGVSPAAGRTGASNNSPISPQNSSHSNSNPSNGDQPGLMAPPSTPGRREGTTGPDLTNIRLAGQARIGSSGGSQSGRGGTPSSSPTRRRGGNPGSGLNRSPVRRIGPRADTSQETRRMDGGESRMSGEYNEKDNSIIWEGQAKKPLPRTGPSLMLPPPPRDGTIVAQQDSQEENSQRRSSSGGSHNQSQSSNSSRTVPTIQHASPRRGSTSTRRGSIRLGSSFGEGERAHRDQDISGATQNTQSSNDSRPSSQSKVVAANIVENFIEIRTVQGGEDPEAQKARVALVTLITKKPRQKTPPIEGKGKDWAYIPNRKDSQSQDESPSRANVLVPDSSRDATQMTMGGAEGDIVEETPMRPPPPQPTDPVSPSKVSQKGKALPSQYTTSSLGDAGGQESLALQTEESPANQLGRTNTMGDKSNRRLAGTMASTSQNPKRGMERTTSAASSEGNFKRGTQQGTASGDPASASFATDMRSQAYAGNLAAQNAERGLARLDEADESHRAHFYQQSAVGRSQHGQESVEGEFRSTDRSLSGTDREPGHKDTGKSHPNWTVTGVPFITPGSPIARHREVEEELVEDLEPERMVQATRSVSEPQADRNVERTQPPRKYVSTPRVPRTVVRAVSSDEDEPTTQRRKQRRRAGPSTRAEPASSMGEKGKHRVKTVETKSLSQTRVVREEIPASQEAPEPAINYSQEIVPETQLTSSDKTASQDAQSPKLRYEQGLAANQAAAAPVVAANNDPNTSTDISARALGLIGTDSDPKSPHTSRRDISGVSGIGGQDISQPGILPILHAANADKSGEVDELLGASKSSKSGKAGGLQNDSSGQSFEIPDGFVDKITSQADASADISRSHEISEISIYREQRFDEVIVRSKRVDIEDNDVQEQPPETENSRKKGQKRAKVVAPEITKTPQSKQQGPPQHTPSRVHAPDSSPARLFGSSPLTSLTTSNEAVRPKSPAKPPTRSQRKTYSGKRTIRSETESTRPLPASDQQEENEVEESLALLDDHSSQSLDPYGTRAILANLVEEPPAPKKRALERSPPPDDAAPSQAGTSQRPSKRRRKEQPIPESSTSNQPELEPVDQEDSANRSPSPPAAQPRKGRVFALWKKHYFTAKGDEIKIPGKRGGKLGRTATVHSAASWPDNETVEVRPSTSPKEILTVVAKDLAVSAEIVEATWEDRLVLSLQDIGHGDTLDKPAYSGSPKKLTGTRTPRVSVSTVLPEESESESQPLPITRQPGPSPSRVRKATGSSFEEHPSAPPGKRRNIERLSPILPDERKADPFQGYAFITALPLNNGAKPIEKAARIKQRKELEKTIKRLGGRVINNGFEELIDWGGQFSDDGKRWIWTQGSITYLESEQPSTSARKKRGKAPAPAPESIFLVADGVNRNSKYMLALATGIPCIDKGWIDDETGRRTLFPPVTATSSDNNAANGSTLNGQHAHGKAVEIVHDLRHASLTPEEYNMIIYEGEIPPNVESTIGKQGSGKVVCVTVGWLTDCLIAENSCLCRNTSTSAEGRYKEGPWGMVEAALGAVPSGSNHAPNNLIRAALGGQASLVLECLMGAPVCCEPKGGEVEEIVGESGEQMVSFILSFYRGEGTMIVFGNRYFYTIYHELTWRKHEMLAHRPGDGKKNTGRGRPTYVYPQKNALIASPLGSTTATARQSHLCDGTLFNSAQHADWQRNASIIDQRSIGGKGKMKWWWGG
ncbi:17545_t:CDS:10, partial [Acaulospora colombiana]